MGRERDKILLQNLLKKICRLVTMKWTFNKYVLNKEAGWNVSYILQLI